MRHLFCNGHGALENSQSFSKCFVPKGKILVMYTPPGAALADNLANFIMEGFVKNKFAKDLTWAIKEIHEFLFIKGRASKGFEGAIPPFGAESYPLVIVGNDAKCVPNMTLEGDPGLSRSGCFDDLGRNQWPLDNYEKITLRTIFQKMSQADVVHWLACASDHTKEKAHNPFYGFKMSKES